MQRIFILLIYFFLFSYCSKKIELKNFDSEAWKKDEQGCNGLRMSLSDNLEAQRNNLKGAQEVDVIKILGRPNSIQIMERKQKYYTYWISNPAVCNKGTVSKEVKIRISALNQVSEILFN